MKYIYYFLSFFCLIAFGGRIFGFFSDYIKSDALFFSLLISAILFILAAERENISQQVFISAEMKRRKKVMIRSANNGIYLCAILLLMILGFSIH